MKERPNDPLVYLAECERGGCIYGKLVRRFNTREERDEWALVHVRRFKHNVTRREIERPQ